MDTPPQTPRSAEELKGLLDFLRAAEALKTQTRTSWTSAGRRESVAEHTWRLCLMALVFKEHFPAADFAKLVTICIVHDLGEAISGDISAVVQAERQAAATPEARLAKALDKLETILQHNQGANPADFDYRFNLGYGRQYTTGDPVLEAVRALLDTETSARAEATQAKQ